MHLIRESTRIMTEISEKTIDINKILNDKMGARAKMVPSVATNWLKSIIHQDEVNKFLWESRDKVGVDWLEECVRYLDMTLKLEGEENLPAKDDGKLYTFVSNHPLGGQDGVALGAIIGRHYDGNFKQPHADVPCWLVFQKNQWRNKGLAMEKDFHIEKCGYS